MLRRWHKGSRESYCYSSFREWRFSCIACKDRPWRSWLSGAIGTSWSWMWPRPKNSSSISEEQGSTWTRSSSWASQWKWLWTTSTWAQWYTRSQAGHQTLRHAEKSEPTHAFSRKTESVTGWQEDPGSLLPDKIQNATFYNQACCFDSSKKADTERLGKVARTAAKMEGTETTALSAMYGSVAVKKLHRILWDTQHPLNHALSFQASRRDISQRLRCFRTRTSRIGSSFQPTAIRLHY